MHLLNILWCILLTGCLSINTVKALRCHKCGSENQNDCTGPLISIDDAEKCPTLDMQCFTLKLGHDIIRGCKSDIPGECTTETCGIEYCNSNACNKGIYAKPVPTLRCYQCSGEGCKSTIGITAKLCTNFSEEDSCYFYLDSKRNVWRGCASDDYVPCRGTECDRCETSGCNGKTYNVEPILKCYQCSGEDCSTVLQKSPQLCENFNKDEQCYTYVDSAKNVFRGCISDIKSLCKHPSCVTCEEPGCNNHPEIIKYSCNVCKGNSKSCMGESGKKARCSVSTPGQCTVLLGRTPSCFTYFETGKFERGCGQNFPKSYDTQFLKTCDGKNCNSECVTNFEDEGNKTDIETAELEISLSEEELLIENGPAEVKDKIPTSQELVSHMPTGKGLMFKLSRKRLSIILRGNQSLKV